MGRCWLTRRVLLSTGKKHFEELLRLVHMLTHEKAELDTSGELDSDEAALVVRSLCSGKAA